MEQICNRCNENKNIEYFYCNKFRKNGHETICKECRKKISRIYETKIKLNRVEKRLAIRYGINTKIYNELFLKQNGKCAICGINQNVLKNRLSVDHNHKTGYVRGLLCSRCNRRLGFYNENINLLYKAIKYLKQYNN